MLNLIAVLDTCSLYSQLYFQKPWSGNVVGTVPKKEICEKSFEFPRKEDSKILMNSQSKACFLALILGFAQNILKLKCIEITVTKT